MNMELQRARSAGGIVLGDHGEIVLVQRKGGDRAWLFPKGHVEGEETDEETARREIQEETGLTNLELIDDLGSFERPGIDAYGDVLINVLKEIHLFLFVAPLHAQLAPEMPEEIGAAEWVPFREVSARIGNEKERVFFSTVTERVRQAIQRD